MISVEFKFRWIGDFQASFIGGSKGCEEPCPNAPKIASFDTLLAVEENEITFSKSYREFSIDVWAVRVEKESYQSCWK